jgi:serine protease Do
VGTSSSAYGSGTIIDVTRKDANNNNVDGENIFYVLTCHHVVEYEGNEIYVYIPDREGDNYGESDYNQDFVLKGRIGGTTSGEVSLIGGDLKSDVAVLKIDISGTKINKEDIIKSPIAPVTYQVQVGEDVFAIGNPSGKLPGTVSVGTISYINRETIIDPIGEMTLLQMNTDIFHGSSVGALYNMYGEIIGLTNSGSDTYVGICYAVPHVINLDNGLKDNGFVNIVGQLLGTYTGDNFGYISGRRETFGFTVTPMDKEEYLKVTEIVSGSQAEKKGLKVEDVVVAIQEVSTP